jgi:hypothetical protein
MEVARPDLSPSETPTAIDAPSIIHAVRVSFVRHPSFDGEDVIVTRTGAEEKGRFFRPLAYVVSCWTLPRLPPRGPMRRQSSSSPRISLEVRGLLVTW